MSSTADSSRRVSVRQAINPSSSCFSLGRAAQSISTKTAGRQREPSLTQERVELVIWHSKQGTLPFAITLPTERTYISLRMPVVGWWRYLGQMVYGGYQMIPNRTDAQGNLRQVIQFHLIPLWMTQEDLLIKQPSHSIQEIRQRYPNTDLFNSREDSETSKENAKALALARSGATRTAVLDRANGSCEGCGNPAPFLSADGTPYLEPHHVRRKTDGGPDDPSWVIALCPNCHRRAHKSMDNEAFNAGLKGKLAILAE